MNPFYFKFSNTFNYLLLYGILNAFMSCNKTDPKPEPPANNEELITTCILQLTDSASGLKNSYAYLDLDGPGGTAPTFGGDKQSDSLLVLKKTSVYYARLILLNQTKQPVDTVSNEVLEEAEDHRVFFNPEDHLVVHLQPFTIQLKNPLLQIVYADTDVNQKPLGLQTRWYPMETSPASAPLKIVLKHQPGVKNGNFAPGETDLEVVFKVRIH